MNKEPITTEDILSSLETGDVLKAPIELIKGNVSGIEWSQISSKIHWFSAVARNTTWKDEVLANMFRALAAYSTRRNTEPTDAWSIETFIGSVLETRPELPPILIGTINSVTREVLNKTDINRTDNARFHRLTQSLIKLVASEPRCLKGWEGSSLHSLGMRGQVGELVKILETGRMLEEHLIQVIYSNSIHGSVLQAIMDNYAWTKIPHLKRTLWETGHPVAIVEAALDASVEDTVLLFRKLDRFNNSAKLQVAFIEGLDEPRREALRGILPELLQGESRELRLAATRLLKASSRNEPTRVSPQKRT